MGGLAGSGLPRYASGMPLGVHPPRPLAAAPQVYIDGVLRVPYDNMLRVHQVRPELQVVDPGNA